MKKQLEPLTKQQKELTEINHNLIYEFAKRKNLMINDYYDILAIGLCKAAAIFEENKGKFSTIAYRCMENELTDYYKYIKREHRIPEEMILSYDAPKSTEDSDDKDSFLNTFADSCCTHDIVSSDMMTEFLVNLLSEKEKMIVEFIVEGMSQDEIASIMSCKRQNVGYYMKQIRKKWANYYI